jgi:hypothetical protein
VTYANWFSYVTEDFVSENREIYRAIRITRALFPHTKIRFVGDANLDDQKIFQTCQFIPPTMPKLCTLNGGIARGLNIPIALTKKMDWMWKMCECRDWNGCVASSSWSCLQRCLCIMSLMCGLTTWSCGFVAWEANWGTLRTAMAPTSSSKAFALSSSPPPHSHLPHNTRFLE